MIVEIGSVNVDRIIHMQKTPQPGETVYGQSLDFMAGGKGANQIAAAARLGAQTELLAAIGAEDNYNDMLMEDLSWAGVGTDHLKKVEGGLTGSAFCMIGDDAQKQIVILEGANAEVTPEYIVENKEIIAGATLIMCEFGIRQEACEAAMRLGKKLGVTTLCNPAPFRKPEDSFYQYVDIITPNEVEASEACGFLIDDEVSAAKGCDYFHEKGVKNVIITLGDRGAFCSNRDEKLMIKGYKVEAYDTSGAGDSFNGGFAYAFDKGYDFFECARFANAVASRSVQVLGTMRSMPSLEEVEAIFQLNK